MRRLLVMGALGAGVAALLYLGNPPAATATLSPLPEPVAELVAQEVGTMLAITDAAPHLLLSQRLQLAARAQALNLVAERRGRDAADMLHLWQTIQAAGYAQTTPSTQTILIEPHTPEAVANGLEIGKSPILAGKYTHVGVGIAREGDQWRTVIVAVYAPETVQTSGTSSEMGAYLPTVTR